MIFEATIHSNILKKLIDSIKELVIDGNIEVSSGGVSLQAMDSSHVSLVSLELNSDKFLQYKCESNLTLGINLPNLSRILKCSGNDDCVTLSASQDSEYLNILFESPCGECVSDFELKLIDIETDTLGIPVQEYTAVVKMRSVEFQRIVRDLSVIGDVCSICCKDNSISFSVNGDVGNGSITLNNKDDDDTIEIRTNTDIEQKFTFRYLNYFTKATNVSDKIQLSMSHELPVLITYNIQDGGGLSFYLAPKIYEE